MKKPDLKSQFWRYYLPLFLAFSVAVLAFQYNREKKYKADLLDTKLGDSNAMIFKYLDKVNGSLDKMDSVILESPYSDDRITIIDLNGKVVYDNIVKDVSTMENHLNRREISDATKNGSGSDIRTSKTNKHPYYYHADRFGNCYIRTSVPYSMNITAILSPDNLFLYFWLIATFLILSILFYLSNRFTIKLQREQIEHDANIRRQLTQQVAHELKTPLSSIIGYMETLHNNPDISEERKNFFIDRSYSQAVRLNELLKDILVLNQLNEVPQSIKREPVLLNKIINNVIEDVDLKLKEKGMTVNTSLGGDIWLKANGMLLYSLFRNLIDNAIAYAGENTRIDILLAGENNQQYMFSFSDNGVGVNEDNLPFLFDRFYRIDDGRSRKTGGTGLGLAIVKNAVEFHNGKITVHNKQGGGLEFRFGLHK
jgi:two-component system, OmpR family, sensor kinase